ncbi:MAG: hypothetical protein JRJ24_14585 [Deltaproteobacteria bacterium]|nr:hypothetical protein [Deltaproteobacteria bacterium]
MTQTTSIGLLAVALLLATSPVHAAGEADVRTAQIAKEGSNISWGHAVAVIDQPIDEVLPVVVDYGNYVHFMPNFTKSRVIAQRGNRAMVYMEVSVASGTFTLWGRWRRPHRGRFQDLRRPRHALALVGVQPREREGGRQHAPCAPHACQRNHPAFVSEPPQGCP